MKRRSNFSICAIAVPVLARACADSMRKSKFVVHAWLVRQRYASFALILVMALLLGSSLASPAEAQADPWPNRPVMLVVPYAAGGNVDIAARIFARVLSDKIGQPVVVENKSGAGGIVGTVAVAKAAPDGYTLLLTAGGPAALNALLYSSIPYSDSDFTPVVITNDVPQVLISSPKLPVASLKDLVAYAKEKKSINIGHAGPGTVGQLAALLLELQTGIDAALVSYRGAGEIIKDVLGGQIEAGFPAYVPQVATVKVLGVATAERVAFIPDAPTIRESGIADVTASTWNALMGPAGMPRAIVMKLNAAINEYLKTDQAKQELAKIGARALGGTPEDVAKTIADDRKRWGPIIRTANIKLDP